MTIRVRSCPGYAFLQISAEEQAMLSLGTCSFGSIFLFSALVTAQAPKYPRFEHVSPLPHKDAGGRRSSDSRALIPENIKTSPPGKGRAFQNSRLTPPFDQPFEGLLGEKRTFRPRHALTSASAPHAPS